MKWVLLALFILSAVCGIGAKRASNSANIDDRMSAPIAWFACLVTGGLGIVVAVAWWFFAVTFR